MGPALEPRPPFRRGRAAASRVAVSVALFVALSPVIPASAQTTTTYTYDARGRLVTTQHAGGINDGVATALTYDPADNRTNITTTGQSRRRVVVLPLNGFTVIPIDQ